MFKLRIDSCPENNNGKTLTHTHTRTKNTNSCFNVN